MIFRFDILSVTGLWDGWAHTRDEMAAKYLAEYPDEPKPYIFLCGDAPRAMDYQSYKQAAESGLNEDQIRVVDQYLLGLAEAS